MRVDLVSESFVVAIDGPAGAGKSSASRLLADRLGFEFLDTGAMYRCVTLAVLRAGVDATDEARVEQLASQLDIRLERDRVWLDGEDVSEAIRKPEVSSAIGKVADNPCVRELLSRRQREWAEGKCVVSEGRDQGTLVFYDSPCKIFLTASDEERAQRRCEELAQKGIVLPLNEVLAQQRARDTEDRERAIGGLRQAPDAELIVTDGMPLDAVVDRMAALVRSRMAQGHRCHTVASQSAATQSAVTEKAQAQHGRTIGSPS